MHHRASAGNLSIKDRAPNVPGAHASNHRFQFPPWRSVTECAAHVRHERNDLLISQRVGESRHCTAGQEAGAVMPFKVTRIRLRAPDAMTLLVARWMPARRSAAARLMALARKPLRRYAAPVLAVPSRPVSARDPARAGLCFQQAGGFGAPRRRRTNERSDVGSDRVDILVRTPPRDCRLPPASGRSDAMRLHDSRSADRSQRVCGPRDRCGGGVQSGGVQPSASPPAKYRSFVRRPTCCVGYGRRRNAQDHQRGKRLCSMHALHRVRLVLARQKEEFPASKIRARSFKGKGTSWAAVRRAPAPAL